MTRPSTLVADLLGGQPDLPFPEVLGRVRAAGYELVAVPSMTAPFRSLVASLLGGQPALGAAEVLRRTRAAGYRGARTPMQDLVADVRREMLEKSQKGTV